MLQTYAEQILKTCEAAKHRPTCYEEQVPKLMDKISLNFTINEGGSTEENIVYKGKVEIKNENNNKENYEVRNLFEPIFINFSKTKIMPAMGALNTKVRPTALPARIQVSKVILGKNFLNRQNILRLPPTSVGQKLKPIVEVRIIFP